MACIGEAAGRGVDTGRAVGATGGCAHVGRRGAETEVGLASRVEGLVASEAVEGCAAAMVARAVGAEETAETAVAMAAGLEAATVELSPGPACRADAQATVAWAVAEGLGGA